MNRREGHEILETLHNPPDEEPRIDKRYQTNTSLHRVSIDEPGLTAIYSVVHVRDSILEDDTE